MLIKKVSFIDHRKLELSSKTALQLKKHEMAPYCVIQVTGSPKIPNWLEKTLYQWSSSCTHFRLVDDGCKFSVSLVVKWLTSVAWTGNRIFLGKRYEAKQMKMDSDRNRGITRVSAPLICISSYHQYLRQFKTFSTRSVSEITAYLLIQPAALSQLWN